MPGVTGAEVELADLPDLPRTAQRAIAFWRYNPMLPPSYIDSKTGRADLEGMERAARILIRLDQDVEATLGDTFNIKGNIGFKADLQRALLALVPGYAIDFLEVSSEHVTARILTPNLGWSSPLTKRLTREASWEKDDPDKGWRGDRDMITYAKGNETNYRDKPNRMLEARVSTELIDLYAKGVIRGLVRAQAGDAAAYYSDQGEEEAVSELDPGTLRPGPGSLMVPARSVAPDGSTIPESLREPPVDDDVRASLIARVAELPEDIRDELSVALRRPTDDNPLGLGMPNIKGQRLTRCHGALLSRLIDEAVELAALRHADPETGEIADHHDDGRPFS